MENKWIYLPEVPDTNREVLVAIKGADCTIQGYYTRNGYWLASEEAISHMMNVEFYGDTNIKNVYAWCELPKLPPLPEQIQTV